MRKLFFIIRIGVWVYDDSKKYLNQVKFINFMVMWCNFVNLNDDVHRKDALK